MYRRAPLSEKKGKDNFRQLVRKCILREALTVKRRRKFLKRARQYILAYTALAKARNAPADTFHDTDSKMEIEMSASLIEKIVKLYKAHRNIVDQEKGFINSTVDIMKKI